MGESYVRPVTAAREPAPEWHAVWRFRAVSLVLLVALGVAFAWGVNAVLHASDQDPSTGDDGMIPSTAPATPGP